MKTEELILREASQLFTKGGLAALSMRKLAERVGVSATAIYRHYASKEALLTSVCHSGFATFAEYLFVALQEDDELERLRRTGEQYKRFALEHPNFYQVMFMTSTELLGWADMPKAHRQSLSATFQFLVDRVGACISDGLFVESDARQVSAQIWSQCHGLVALRLLGHLTELDSDGFDRFYRATCDRQLNSFLRKAN